MSHCRLISGKWDQGSVRRGSRLSVSPAQPRSYQGMFSSSPHTCLLSHVTYFLFTLDKCLNYRYTVKLSTW